MKPAEFSQHLYKQATSYPSPVSRSSNSSSEANSGAATDQMPGHT